MPDDEGYWRFCDIVERRVITSSIITSPPQTQQVVLEQHTETGEYRLRSLASVTEEAEHV